MNRNIHLYRDVARAAVILVMAGAVASPAVASAEPDNGVDEVTVGESFHIWLRNPHQASWNCWQAAQDHNRAIDRADYDGIVDALERVERYECDVEPR
jgi:hypothetical protein